MWKKFLAVTAIVGLLSTYSVTVSAESGLGDEPIDPDLSVTEVISNLAVSPSVFNPVSCIHIQARLSKAPKTLNMKAWMLSIASKRASREGTSSFSGGNKLKTFLTHRSKMFRRRGNPCVEYSFAFSAVYVRCTNAIKRFSYLRSISPYSLASFSIASAENVVISRPYWRLRCGVLPQSVSIVLSVPPTTKCVRECGQG